jgi:putative tricarboxylic transport membrane protein
MVKPSSIGRIDRWTNHPQGIKHDMKKCNRMSSLVWLFFALYICVESLRLPLGSWRDPGPGFLPLGAGLCLGILSAIDYFQTRFRKGKGIQESWYSKERWKSILLILLALLGYSIFLDSLGFLVTTFFLLILLFRFVKPQPWRVVIGGSLLASVSSYVVFEIWLKTQLPRGVLGF